MATEPLYAVGYTTAPSSPTNALGAPNGVGTTDTGNTSWTAHYVLAEPSTGWLSGTHPVVIVARKEPGQSGTPSMTVSVVSSTLGTLFTSGSVNVTQTAFTAISMGTMSATGQVGELSMDISVSAAGGSPSTRTTIQVDAMYVTANVVAAPSPPAAPSNLVGVSAPDGTYIDWSWTDNSSDEISFQIMVDDNGAFDGGTDEYTVAVGAGVTTWRQTALGNLQSVGITPGITQYAQVRARGSQVDSAWVGPASVTTTTNTPKPFTGTVAATSGASGAMRTVVRPTGTVGGTSGTQGTMRAVARFSGTVSGTSGTQGSLSPPVVMLSGTVAGTSGATATLGAAPVSFSGTVAAASGFECSGGAGAGPGYVQHKSIGNVGGSPSLALDNPPTEGNTLVALFAVQSNLTILTPNSGWLPVSSNVAQGDIGNLYYHHVGAGESATVNPLTIDNTGRRWALTVAEYEGIDWTTDPLIGFSADASAFSPKIGSDIAPTATGGDAIFVGGAMSTSYTTTYTSENLLGTGVGTVTQRVEVSSGTSTSNGTTTDYWDAVVTGVDAGPYVSRCTPNLAESGGVWGAMFRGAAGGGGECFTWIPGDVPLSGTVAGTSSVIGSMSATVQLSGTVAGVSGASGAITTQGPPPVPFSGTVAGTSSTSGSVKVISPFSATVSGTSAATGALNVIAPNVQLAGTVAATSGVQGTAKTVAAFSGTVNAVSATSGFITLEGALAFNGSVNAVSGVIDSGFTIKAGVVRYWDGAAWQTQVPLVWDGAQWIQGPGARYWDGAAWQPVVG
jgi:hypothetical protein